MKIVFNVEKKHLIFFGLFLVLVGSLYAIATPIFPAKVGHQELQADVIYPFSSENGNINIPKNLRIGDNNDGSSWKVGITGNTILRGDLRIEKNICDKNNRCIPIEDLIDKMKESEVGSQGNNNNNPKEERFGRTPSINDDPITKEMLGQKYRIRENDRSIRKFCEEKGYSGYKNVVAFGCGESERTVAYYNTYDNNEWELYGCGQQLGKYIADVTCYNN